MMITILSEIVGLVLLVFAFAGAMTGAKDATIDKVVDKAMSRFK